MHFKVILCPLIIIRWSCIPLQLQSRSKTTPPFRGLLRGILCYHRFAKKGTMYKQSQEQQCWIWVEWSQELHNTQSFLPPVGIRTMQSLFSKMAFTASCLPWNLKYSNTIIFLKKCLGQRLLPGQMVVTMVSHQLHHPLRSG